MFVRSQTLQQRLSGRYPASARAKCRFGSAFCKQPLSASHVLLDSRYPDFPAHRRSKIRALYTLRLPTVSYVLVKMASLHHVQPLDEPLPRPLPASVSESCCCNKPIHLGCSLRLTEDDCGPSCHAFQIAASGYSVAFRIFAQLILCSLQSFGPCLFANLCEYKPPLQSSYVASASITSLAAVGRLDSANFL